ncbi:MAG: LysR family transcriptional regulator [Dehalococcoidales bacterium]|nr:LysR family transcriptional regulator [Dehalococcoidales bacterium]
MQARFKLWVEKDGELVLSAWRTQLLETIDEAGSISEAAHRLGVHYRIAWARVHQMEQRLGVRLVEGRSGGAGGGGARLTAAGREQVRKFHQLSRDLQEQIDSRLAELYGEER